MGQMTPSIDHVKYFIWRKPGAGARRRGGERVDVLQEGGKKQKLENVWRGFNAVNVPVALQLKPWLPDVTVRMFCKLKLLCRIPIRPVNLAKIALNKWTAVYLYSPHTRCIL